MSRNPLPGNSRGADRGTSDRDPARAGLVRNTNSPRSRLQLNLNSKPAITANPWPLDLTKIALVAYPWHHSKGIVEARNLSY